MPCSDGGLGVYERVVYRNGVDPIGMRTLELEIKRLIERNDLLASRLDVVREAYLAMAVDGIVPEPSMIAWIKKEQIEHRQVDLDRLRRTFGGRLHKTRSVSARAKYERMLALVEMTDPKLALAPQLGFDPNDY